MYPGLGVDDMFVIVQSLNKLSMYPGLGVDDMFVIVQSLNKLSMYPGLGVDDMFVIVQPLNKLSMYPGLGVDDMFVIVQSLNSLTPKQQEVDIPHKMAAVLRHAGVSITVTSLTDLAGFLVGSTTVSSNGRNIEYQTCFFSQIGLKEFSQTQNL